MTDAAGGLFEQMQQMLQGMQDAQEDLESLLVVGTSGGGAVRVTANASPEVKRVDITPEALEDPEMLGDLIVVAVNDALHKATEAAQERLGGLDFSGFQVPGLDLSGLQVPGLELPSFDDDDDEDFEDDEEEE